MKLKLNDEQKEAVYCEIASSVLVEAGAGTGKTRVLIARAMHLECKGVLAKNIATIAYTKSVAREINTRFKEHGSKCTATTIHSKCFSELRTNPESKYRKYKQISTGKLHKVFKGLVKKHAPELLREYQAIMNHFSQNRLKERKSTAYLPKHWKAYEKQLSKVSKRYFDYKFRNKLLDYNDMIIKTANLLENKDAAAHAAERIQHLLVDEAQDLSKPMWSIIKSLKDAGAKLFLVGDQAQAIMGYAGADVKQFNTFESDYSDVSFVRLVQNYRCSPEILTLSNWCRKEVSKKLQPIKANVKSGELPSCFDAPNFNNAVDQIVQDLSALSSTRNTAILVRTNSQADKIEQKLSEAELQLKSEDSPEGIEIITIHKAKGREWQNCYVIDPRLSGGRASGQNTEQCLCYVSLTRARERLVVCFSTKGSKFNSNPNAKETYIFDKFPRKLCK